MQKKNKKSLLKKQNKKSKTVCKKMKIKLKIHIDPLLSK